MVRYIRDDDKIIYFIKQRISGAVLILISLMIPCLTDGDISASVLIALCGIWLLCTKNEIMTFAEWEGWKE